MITESVPPDKIVPDRDEEYTQAAPTSGGTGMVAAEGTCAVTFGYVLWKLTTKLYTKMY